MAAADSPITAAPSSFTSLPPTSFDQKTVSSLIFLVVLVLAAYAASLRLLPAASANRTLRFLFIWHLTDALYHLVLEGSFVYHCLFTSRPLADFDPAARDALFPTPRGYLGSVDRVYGPQAGGDNPFAQLWLVYSRADKRWAGVDVGVVSLELLTVVFDGLLACYICYCLAKRDPKASIWMIILATCELYGGFMTFCPEWLIGSPNLDTSNAVYLWLFLFFFNTVWVWVPLWIIWYSVRDITGAFHARDAKKKM